jgi:heterodisulfide reductase subunit C
MPDFGYIIAKTRLIDLDVNELWKTRRLENTVISFKRCVNCGSCAATCSAGLFSDFDIRKIHSLFRRGQYHELDKALSQCMLCGKCTLACPRDVNLRAMIINMRQLLAEKH